MRDPVTFEIAAPDSKKNRGAIIKIPGRGYSYTPGRTAVAQEKAIRSALASMIGVDKPWFGTDDVAVSLDFYPREDVVKVHVEHVAAKPRGYSGRRRDLANLFEVVLDAMQGPVYVNDNQVAALVARRWLP